MEGNGGQPLRLPCRRINPRFCDGLDFLTMRLPLMIPFTMVVRNIFVQRPTQRALAKEKNLRQTLLFCRSYPALRVGVQIWTSRRDHVEDTDSLEGHRIPPWSRCGPLAASTARRGVP